MLMVEISILFSLQGSLVKQLGMFSSSAVSYKNSMVLGEFLHIETSLYFQTYEISVKVFFSICLQGDPQIISC